MPVSESYVAGDELAASDVVSIAKAVNRAFAAGIIYDFFGREADVPTGCLLCSGKTIGDASSNATARANADMSTLFAILWAVGNADATLDIFTSAGDGSTYGANAAADFAAHKAIALPDLRGRASIGKDNLGGTDAGRIVVNNTAGNKVGGAVGEETHTLLLAEAPAHKHLVGEKLNASGSGTLFAADGRVPTEANNVDTSTVGGDGAHNNMQPSIFLCKIIASGVTW